MNSKIFTATTVRLIYIYPGDDPDREYAASPDPAGPVLERCTDESLVKTAIEFEKLRYSFQVEIGKRGLGQAVDEAAASYFQTGKLATFKTPIVRGQAFEVEDIEEVDLEGF